VSNVNPRNSKKVWLALALAPALIAAAALASRPGNTPDPEHPAAAAAAAHADSLSLAFRAAAKAVQPSVVLIKTQPTMPIQWKGRGESQGDRSLERRFFGETPFGDIPELKRFFDQMPDMPNMPEMPGGPEEGHAGLGSGVIIDASGVILTNNHVVAGRNDVTVRLHDGREFKATEVKTDPNSDLAVVRIEGADNLVAAKLGDSDELEVGDWVLALGHPFGLEGTVTSGIVSAKARGIGMPARADFIQTDAAINPGNSGGPLVNLKGEVVGVNTAISTRNGGNQGIGFAIPSNLAKWVSRELIENGSVSRAQLGVMIQALSPDLAEQFGVEPGQGVLVADVAADTPAAKAGVKAGDVILEYEGHAVSTPRELQAVVERSAVGEKHSLVVMRDGKQTTLEAVPHETPADAEQATEGLQSPERQESSRFEKLGIEVENLTAELARQLGVDADHGAVITDVLSGSPADRAGLEAGMVVLQANRKPVQDVAGLKTVLESSKGDMLLLVRSEQGSRFVIVHTEG
jgi:serine protease Do